MARIVFLAPFAKSEISGGIKTCYRHAELLTELGFEAAVYQPDGAPTWFMTRARTIAQLNPVADDVLVFPETLNGVLAELAQHPTQARKILFCQNQYYMAMNQIPARDLRGMGFTHFAASSIAARDFLGSVLGIKDAGLIPHYIDAGIFRPREKIMQIALVPRKMPREASLVSHIFRAKYRDLSRVPWQVIENKNERETADILGRSHIFLSLSFFESFGLVPVEAMASGCIVAGFDGYGGREYACPENGLWLPPDHAEETADAIEKIITGIQENTSWISGMREAGRQTAARYGKDRTTDALMAFYGPLLKR